MRVDAKVEPTELAVTLSVENGGASEIYVLDRLWVADPKGKLSWDPEQAYRFVHRDSLRLLLGPSPVATNMSVNNPQFPQATKVPAGGRLAISIKTKVPVTEYSLFSSDAAGGSRPVRATSLDVIVQYAVQEEGVVLRPSTIEPTAAFVVSTGRTKLRAAYGSAKIQSIEVVERSGPTLRVRLPGD